MQRSSLRILSYFQLRWIFEVDHRSHTPEHGDSAINTHPYGRQVCYTSHRQPAIACDHTSGSLPQMHCPIFRTTNAPQLNISQHITDGALDGFVRRRRIASQLSMSMEDPKQIR